MENQTPTYCPWYFFASFGTIILLSSVSSPFTYKLIEPGSQTHQPEGNMHFNVSYLGSYLGTIESAEARKLILDITTVIGFLTSQNTFSKLSDDDQRKAGDAITRLIRLRSELLDIAYDDGWSGKYIEYSKKYKTQEEARTSLTSEEYEIFQEIYSSFSFETK